MIKLKCWVKQLSIRKKILISHLLIIMIPITVLEVAAYFYSSKVINEKIMGLLHYNNEQMVNNIDIILENTSRLTERPLLDNTISEILMRDYGEVDPSKIKYEKIQDRDMIVSAVYRGIIYANSYVQSVEIMAENTHDIFCIGSNAIGNIRSYEQIAEETWCRVIADSNGVGVIIGKHRDNFLSPEKEYVSVGRSIILDPLSSQLSNGIIKININVESLQRILEKFNWVNGILTVLVDENGNIICSNRLEDMAEQEISELIPKDYSNRFQHDLVVIDNKKYIRSISSSNYSDWKMVNLIPKSELFAETYQFGTVLFTIGLILLFAALCISFITSRSITRPIMDLKRNLQEMQDGNLDVRAKVEGGELGELAAAFNNMASQIQRSLDEIYMKEKEKRNAELLALQAQINPHFFHNTLGTIKWMADVQGAYNVAEAIDALINMLKAVAQIKGDMVTIQEDLEIIRLYSEILMIRYMDRFKVEYNIDGRLIKYKTIKFLLQPILENAIFHGFDENNEEGLIIVSVKSSNSDIIFEVRDNGKGMDDATIKRILSEESENQRGFNKIGIYNVNNRLKLTFGKKYGLQIESVPGEYTVVRAVIPMVD